MMKKRRVNSFTYSDFNGNNTAIILSKMFVMDILVYLNRMLNETCTF